MSHRIGSSIKFQTFIFLIWTSWRAGGLMLIRMAFTNYLLQTIICTFIFYGHGFGLFAKLERIYQLVIVIIIWIFLIVFSNVLLKYFQYGQAEWLWRSLTYMKKQQFKNN
jgi:uncharacterized protein